MVDKITVCPVCASGSTKLFAEKSGYLVYLCEFCGFGFVNPVPTKEELAKIYGQNYFRNKGKKDGGYTDYDKDKESMRSVFEVYLLKLENLTKVRKIFDVGAATGYFLDIAKKRGWKTFGSEISEYGKEESQKRGHQMYLGPILGWKPEEMMSAVTMWDVLEHVSDPVAYLSAANRMLSPEGIIAINTVDRESLWARILGPKWHLMIPPEHLSYFTRKSLSIALKKSGFEMIEYKKIGKSFSPSYILKTLGSWQGIEFWNILSRATDNPFFRLFSIPINLRDNVFVLAKKTHEIK